jgi:hypothetical protein
VTHACLNDCSVLDSKVGIVRGRTRTLGVLAAASVPSALYVLYVFHYSVNVPYADDWLMVPLALSAVHGHVAVSDLWRQFDDTRLFVPSVLFVVFALVDHFNEKSVILFSAVLFVASYVLLLPLLRAYLAKRLTFVPVLAVAITWFSLADVENALWSFQLAWYLATFCFVAMVYCLVAPHARRTVFVVLGIVAAVVGTYSIDQGFAIWPVGLICLLWNTPWARRTYYELTAWLTAAVITTAIYLPGYSFVNVACPNTPSCGTGYGVLHPQLLARYLALMVGNIVPTSNPVHANLVVHELLGTVIIAVAVFVIVQVSRERRIGVVPLPLLLIVFGLLFDLMISIGRVGQGLTGALSGRYTMPNLILFTGIIVYGCAHPPALRREWKTAGRREWVNALGMMTLGAFLILQVVISTNFGIANGRASHRVHDLDARVVVNLQRIPVAEQRCDIVIAVFPLISPSAKNEYLFSRLRSETDHNHLSVFQAGSKGRYVREGPPTATAITGVGKLASVRDLSTPTCS